MDHHAVLEFDDIVVHMISFLKNKKTTLERWSGWIKYYAVYGQHGLKHCYLGMDLRKRSLQAVSCVQGSLIGPSFRIGITTPSYSTPWGEAPLRVNTRSGSLEPPAALLA